MHFASAAGIDPKTVTVATFAAFRIHLDATLLKDPNKTYCATIDGFRAARGMISGWPDVEIARPNRGKLWTLPWLAFPESLRLDTEAWLDRLSGHDLSSDQPTRPVRPITRHIREYQVRRFCRNGPLSTVHRGMQRFGRLIFSMTVGHGLVMHLVRTRRR